MVEKLIDNGYFFAFYFVFNKKNLTFEKVKFT